MITGIRSAILCRDVRRSSDSIDYIGIEGDTLYAESKPGLINVWLSLILDLDRAATNGLVTVEAADFSYGQPFAAPAGLKQAATAFPLLIPVLKAGALTVSIKEDRQPVRRITWDLAFHPDAQKLGPDAGRDFVEESRKAMAILDGGMNRGPAGGH